MNLPTLALFIPACLALNMAPGPNNLLSLGNATHYGFTRSCAAGRGRLAAFALMLLLTSAGLSVLFNASVMLFMAIKVLGALYLFYLAFQLWTSQPVPTNGVQLPAKGLAALARQEFFVAAANPKAILIFTAFLPQFVNPAAPTGMQFAVLGALFLLLELLAIAAYAYMGVSLRRWFAHARGQRIFNRSCAALLAAAGTGLLAARR